MAKKRRKSKSPSLLLMVLAVFFPFIAVLLYKGLGKTFLINVILCILGYVPGIIHAFWVLLK